MGLHVDLKSKLIRGVDEGETFHDRINNFVKDKMVLDIKYQMKIVPNNYYVNGVPKAVSVVDSALILYKELN